jgi:hypothetical protein
MLSPAELDEVVSHLTYWPGWSFSVFLDDHLGPMLRIVTRQPDREDPQGKTVDLGINARIPPHAIAGRRTFCEWVLWRLEEAAIHEVREGLRYDGQLVSDPHA